MHYDTDVITADVLIIGGGFAGTWAAYRAAEFTDRVVLVDKAYVSRSGASTVSGGITTCPLDEDDLDEWAEEFITRGHFMCNPDWTMQVLQGQVERVKAFERWGVPIVHDRDGKIARFSSRGMIKVRGMQYNPKKAMEQLRQRIVARGVHIVDRVSITDLITSDGEYPTKGAVVGAFGFDVRTGRCVAFSAKRTIVCTGIMAMKGNHRVDNDTGDGPAMGYRAGARVVDLEFSHGGTFSVLMKKYAFNNYNVSVAHGARLINAKGERFMEKYDPVRFERSELARVVAAFTKEIADGHGPVYIDLRQADNSYWSALEAVQTSRGAAILLSNHLPNAKFTPLPIEPTWGIWNGSRSGLRIDSLGRTHLPGLLAAGASSKNEATGTHASAGVPTAYAMNTGYKAGETAGREAVGSDEPEIPVDVLHMLHERVTAPLGRPASCHADDLHNDLCEIQASIVNLFSLNETKLTAMISRTDEIYDMAQNGGAANVHDLVKLHEAVNVAECARLVYAAARDRTESREQFYREDYPDTDDENWFCWHGITRSENGPQFDRDPIPLERFSERIRSKYHPLPKRPSSIAAIMQGNYDPAVYG